jgi:hypothetical protein
MTGHGSRVPTGGIKGAAYSYYAHQTASSVAGVQELMKLSLVSIYCHQLLKLPNLLIEGDNFA